MIAYLAHPIDYNDGSRKNVIAGVKKELQDAGYWVYHPAQAWSVNPGTEPDPMVQEMNLVTLADADLFVAVLWPGFSTIGTILEMDVAAGQHIERVIIGNIKPGVSTKMLDIPIYLSMRDYWNRAQ